MTVPSPTVVPTDPALSKLSKELLVAKTVLDLQDHSNSVSFDELVAQLSGFGSRQVLSRAVDALFDKGVLKAEWTQRAHGESVRVLEVAGEAQEFVRIVSRNYR